MGRGDGEGTAASVSVTASLAIDCRPVCVDSSDLPRASAWL